MSGQQSAKSGDQFRPSARRFAGYDRAARYVDERLGRGRPAEDWLYGSTIFRLKNDTGDDLASSFSVVEVSGPIIEPDDTKSNAEDLAAEFKYRLSLRGVAPTCGGRWVLTKEPIAAGDIGRCVVAGVTAAVVDVIDEQHQYATVIAGDTTKLQSANAGRAELWWKEDGTGEKFAIVHLGPIATIRLWGKPTEDIVYGSSGEVAVWIDGGDSGMTEEVHHTWMGNDEDLGTGQEVEFEWRWDTCRFEIVNSECEAPAAGTGA